MFSRTKKQYVGWYVLHVKFQHEKKINSILEKNELESFLPTITTVRKWSDRKKKIQKPLFPSYIFLFAKSREEFYKALTVDGVFKYLQFGDTYAKVKNDEIIKIKKILGLKGVSGIESTWSTPQIGERMKINYGSLSGLECEVVRIDNNKKILVRIESIKQNIIATVPTEYLENYTR